MVEIAGPNGGTLGHYMAGVFRGDYTHTEVAGATYNGMRRNNAIFKLLRMLHLLYFGCSYVGANEGWICIDVQLYPIFRGISDEGIPKYVDHDRSTINCIKILPSGYTIMHVSEFRIN